MTSPQPEAAPAAPARRSRLPFIALGVFVVLVVAGTAAWFLFLKGKSDPPLSITDCKTTGAGRSVEPSTLDGTWNVVAGASGCETTAGYRVKEEFAGGARKVTANGRTNQVTGAVTVAGGKVTKGSFDVAVNTLTSDESRRDQTIHQRGLQTDQFPKATFALSSPVALPTFTEGTAIDIPVKGSLTLHGVTKPVSITLHVKLTGSTVTVQGSAPVVMADYGIEPPSIGGFVAVSDNGSFEFLVSLSR
jgi:polyisoprenoid-binding protein YceI